MTDKEILKLFNARDERAISECASRYSGYLKSIAMRILSDKCDSEECLNDALYKAWNAIPPAAPERLSTYLGRLIRNLAINRYQMKRSKKRGSGQVEAALCELEECLASRDNVEADINESELKRSLDSFLEKLAPVKRQIFIKRYWYLYSIKDIAREYSLTESGTKSLLYRIRKELKKHLNKEGTVI